MRLVIQRVDEAFTTLNGVIENRISTGLLIFVAVEDKDTFKEVHKMALKVTQAFQSLLSIVKPAGVNLNL